MQKVEDQHSATAGPQTLALPQLKSPIGPVTQRVQRRALMVYILLVVAGVLLSQWGESDRISALGLGIITPGGGFFYTGQWFSLAVTLLLFGVSLLLWFASGNILAPPIVWLGAAGYGAYHAGHPHMSANYAWALWLVPALVIMLLGSVFVWRSTAIKKALNTRAKRNQYLSRILLSPPVEPEFNREFWRELSLEELQQARFVFDRVLQPIDKYDGFDWVEFQFQFAAVRYQLNSINYALALMQYHSTPSFHGYLKQAQRNAIDKVLDKRVWGYWRWEALWGNFTTDFDPIKKDNIMLSGWTGMAIGVYTTVTGDDHYTQPGSMTFTYDNKSFCYDVHTMAECVYNNFQKSEWTLFPCEPNWVYNMCNETGITFLAQHDRLYGTGYCNDVYDDYVSTIDNEFTTVDGRVIALRSQRLGFSIPLLTSPLADASFGMWANATKPLHSQRAWQIFRNEYVHIDDQGEVRIDTQGWDEVDVGSYKPSLISTYGACRGFALEMGDTALADRLMQQTRREYEYVVRDGIGYYTGVSSFANIMNFYASMMRKDAWAQVNNYSLPETILEGPVLDKCHYPDVLVAKAVSHMGSDLELVLYPGGERATQELTVARLKPLDRYEIRTSDSDEPEIRQADAQGCLDLCVELLGRTTVIINPHEDKED